MLGFFRIRVFDKEGYCLGIEEVRDVFYFGF